MRAPRSIALGLAISVSLTALLVTPGAAAVRVAKRRERLLHLVNDYRLAHGERKLREIASLDKLAQQHSLKMASQRTLFHSSDLGSKLDTYSATSWGENVGYGSTVRQVFVLWTRSSPHRANLLNRKFRKAGIGVVASGGWLWVTMIYYG